MAQYRNNAGDGFTLSLGQPESRAPDRAAELVGLLPSQRLAPPWAEAQYLDSLYSVELVDGYRFYPDLDLPLNAGFTNIDDEPASKLLRSIAAVAAGLAAVALGSHLPHEQYESTPLTDGPAPWNELEYPESGMILGPEALMVRRYGKLWVFPRSAVIKVAERRFTRQAVSTGETTRVRNLELRYQSHARSRTFVLDTEVLNVMEDGEEFPVPGVNRVRALRLALLTSWMKQSA